jgi:hypothetical protein
MDTASHIADRVQQRLEETVGVGTFWDRTNEILPGVMEAMDEAAVLTGVVQTVQSTPITLPTGTNFVSLPTNALALIRVNAPVYIPKTSLFALDNINRTWENDTGTQIKNWFPFGVTQFGIYPQLTVQQQITVVYIAYPVTVAPPYTGSESVPFQEEFHESLEQYASHVLRLKEAGYDFYASQEIYQEFLTTMQTLDVFETRHDGLIWNRVTGMGVMVNPVEVR